MLNQWKPLKDACYGSLLNVDSFSPLEIALKTSTVKEPSKYFISSTRARFSKFSPSQPSLNGFPNNKFSSDVQVSSFRHYITYILPHLCPAFLLQISAWYSNVLLS